MGEVKWSVDGKSIFFNRRQTVLRRDVDTGEEASLLQVSVPSFIKGIDLSHDGEWLAILLTSEDGLSSIQVMSAAGSEPRVLAQAEIPFLSICWTADGEELLLTRAPPGTSEPLGPGERRLWRIRVAGGEPQPSRSRRSEACIPTLPSHDAPAHRRRLRQACGRRSHRLG